MSQFARWRVCGWVTDERCWRWGREIAVRSIGIMLLIAAWAKIGQPAVPPFEWLPMGLVVAVEMLSGGWLISGRIPSMARRFNALLFVGFAGVSCWRWISGFTSCGCFGSVGVPPLVMTGLDLIAAALLSWSAGDGRRSLVIGRAGVCLGGCLLAILAVLWPSARPAAPTTMPADWPSELRRGLWFVVLLREGCPSCAARLPALVARAQEDHRNGMGNWCFLTLRNPSILTTSDLDQLPPFITRATVEDGGESTPTVRLAIDGQLR